SLQIHGVAIATAHSRPFFRHGALYNHLWRSVPFTPTCRPWVVLTDASPAVCCPRTRRFQWVSRQFARPGNQPMIAVTHTANLLPNKDIYHSREVFAIAVTLPCFLNSGNIRATWIVYP